MAYSCGGLAHDSMGVGVQSASTKAIRDSNRDPPRKHRKPHQDSRDSKFSSNHHEREFAPGKEITGRRGSLQITNTFRAINSYAEPANMGQTQPQQGRAILLSCRLMKPP